MVVVAVRATSAALVADLHDRRAPVLAPPTGVFEPIEQVVEVFDGLAVDGAAQRRHVRGLPHLDLVEDGERRPGDDPFATRFTIDEEDVMPSPTRGWQRDVLDPALRRVHPSRPNDLGLRTEVDPDRAEAERTVDGPGSGGQIDAERRPRLAGRRPVAQRHRGDAEVPHPGVAVERDSAHPAVLGVAAQAGQPVATTLVDEAEVVPRRGSRRVDGERSLERCCRAGEIVGIEQCQASLVELERFVVRPLRHGSTIGARTRSCIGTRHGPPGERPDGPWANMILGISELRSAHRAVPQLAQPAKPCQLLPCQLAPCQLEPCQLDPCQLAPCQLAPRVTRSAAGSAVVEEAVALRWFDP